MRRRMAVRARKVTRNWAHLILQLAHGNGGAVQVQYRRHVSPKVDLPLSLSAYLASSKAFHSKIVICFSGVARVRKSSKGTVTTHVSFHQDSSTFTSARRATRQLGCKRSTQMWCIAHIYGSLWLQAVRASCELSESDAAVNDPALGAVRRLCEPAHGGRGAHAPSGKTHTIFSSLPELLQELFQALFMLTSKKKDPGRRTHA
jgi:hypothetical protein